MITNLNYTFNMNFTTTDVNGLISNFNLIKDENILLFVSKGFQERSKITEGLADFFANNVVEIIDEKLENPDLKVVLKILNNIKNKQTLIITIGGGSTIDTGKIISAFVNNKEKLETIDQIRKITQNKEYLNNVTIPIIAVPTTTGSGAECTPWATIWDFEEDKKYSIENKELFSSKVYLVPQLLTSMEKNLTLTTTLDALSHAIESFWSVHTNDFVQIFATNAIKLINQNLDNCLDDLENIEYRKNLLMGSTFAGLAFSNTKTTACHSISYYLTLKYGIPHGVAVALTLYEVLKINKDNINNLDKLLESFDVKTIEEIGVIIKKWIEKGYSAKLSYYGVEKEHIETIVKKSFNPERLNNNPVKLSKENIENIINYIY